nr:MAG TPA: hypothetical protein [Caudoviricetes sp.]
MVNAVNESALIGLHLQPFFVSFWLHRSHGVEGRILPSTGLCTASVAHNRQKPLERVIAAFVGVTGGRWIDRIPPRCPRAKMRGI